MIPTPCAWARSLQFSFSRSIYLPLGTEIKQFLDHLRRKTWASLIVDLLQPQLGAGYTLSPGVLSVRILKLCILSITSHVLRHLFLYSSGLYYSRTIRASLLHPRIKSKTNKQRKKHKTHSAVKHSTTMQWKPDFLPYLNFPSVKNFVSYRVHSNSLTLLEAKFQK